MPSTTVATAGFASRARTRSNDLAAFRQRAGAIGLLFVAAALAIVEYRAARGAGAAEFDRVFGPDEYTSREVVTDLLLSDHVAAGARKRIRISAPLENAWMHLTATVLAADGSAVDTRPLYLDYFQRPQRGIHWTWGLPMAGALVRVPPENYRLQLHVDLAPDGAAAPPLRVQVLPEVAGSRARLLTCAVAGVVGLALLLRSFAAGRTRRGVRDAVSPGERGGQSGILPSGRLHFLDGLRGIAAMSVLVCHLFVPEFFPSVRLIEDAAGNQIPELLRSGALGVEIFFVLSGFVIAYSIRRYRVTPGFALRFIGRRFLRLDPPYYAALFLAIVIMAFSMADSLYATWHHFQAGKGVLINAFYLQDILGYQSPFGTVAWTLCLEVQFYLALVVLTGISEWIGGRFAGAGARAAVSRAAWWLLCGGLGIASVVTWESDHGNFNFLATWFRFLLGVLTFRCLNARVSPWPFASLLGGLMIVSIGLSDARGFTAAATAGLILAAGHAGALGRWLDGRMWQSLGRLSYSLYLFHVVLAIPLLTFVWSRLPHTLAYAILLVPLGLVVALACAWLMHVLLERPSLALSRRVGYSRRA